MEHHVDSGDFDWDAVENDDNLELWVIRVPEGVKPKHLEDLKLDAPSTSKTSRIGSIDRKHTSYDVWSLGDHDEDESVGGEELRGLSCLLPRQKKGGKLYQAPKPVARHLVISARPTLPTPAHSSDSSSQSSPLTSHNPARFCYPKEVLKHRFMPLGSLAPVEDLSEIEVDAALLVKKPSHQSHTAAQERGDTSGKKRKGGGDVPKKSKKAKMAA
ncbi:hypothetical protein A0H81_04875 [Grifola frondosa]|uniref:Uncharacterized protein n=1 Tax=Grifola frondosa TaxID=5627 RepID=A0A1C7MDR2_GRIFR|nr:hypothetical protein A0H81_04875 [Grifola frondosa]